MRMLAWLRLPGSPAAPVSSSHARSVCDRSKCGRVRAKIPGAYGRTLQCGFGQPLVTRKAIQYMLPRSDSLRKTQFGGLPRFKGSDQVWE